MLIGVDVHESFVRAVLTREAHEEGETVLAAVTVEGDSVDAALRELVREEPTAHQARTATVCRSVNETELITPRRLSSTVVVRIVPGTAVSAPPMSGWPEDLVRAIAPRTHQIGGGHDFDGQVREGLDEAALVEIASGLEEPADATIAVTAVFAPVDPGHELAAADVLERHAPGARVCLSHEIGALGLLERENATILNAALRRGAAVVTARIDHEVRSVLPHLRTYFAQNDGTSVEVARARRYPIHTLWAGRSCTLAGAAAMARLQDCIVLDVRSGATLVGVVRNDHPSLVEHELSVGGVLLNLQHPATTEVSTALPDYDRLIPRAVAAADPAGRSPVVIAGEEAAHLASAGVGTPVERPELAAAVGAALCPAGAIVTMIVGGDAGTRAARRRVAEHEAKCRAILAGALDRTVTVHSVEEFPLAYLPGDVIGLRVRAVGRRTYGPPEVDVAGTH